MRSRSRASVMVIVGVVVGVVACAALAIIGCSHHEPPHVDASPASLATVSLASAASAAASVAFVDGGASSLAIATSDGGVVDTSSDAGPDPSTLPQTRDRPHADDPALAARAQALWDAIVADDPSIARASFFPLGAYQQVKAIAHPESDWNHRLMAAFGEDIHALHKKLGGKASEAVFVGLDLPDDRARWVEPGEEYNKIGYYRVFGSKLRYRSAPGDSGHDRSFEVTSLISWRGQWYIVHLSSVR